MGNWGGGWLLELLFTGIMMYVKRNYKDDTLNTVSA